MYKYENLLEVIEQKNENRGITFIDSDTDERFLSYKELYSKALGMLYCLQQKGIRPKDELIFQIEDNEEFLCVFWACILGGIIAVPITVGNNEEHRKKVFRIWKVLNNPYIIASQKSYSSLGKYCGIDGNISFEELTQQSIALENMIEVSKHGEVYRPKQDDIAFIQFSSGSTGDPKGVTLTHENLVANTTAIIRGSNITKDDSALNWMPLTHDMGLIGFHITNIVAGINQSLLPTSLFIRHPTLWIEKASQKRATILYSPNFGYKHFLTFYNPDVERCWDLSNVRVIFNGAEPISTDLCNKFLDDMTRYRLKRTAMIMVYGLAEASVGVAFPPLGEAFTSLSLNRKFLNTGEKIKEIDPDDEDSVVFVDEGYAIDFCSIRICDKANNELEEDMIGYVHIKGKNVTSGYYNNPEATKKVMAVDGWLNTGDLGFLRNGRLVITGRAKDIIFINGQNYYPHDIERVAEQVEGIELGKVAACGVYNNKLQKDEIVVFVMFKKKPADFVNIAFKLKSHISAKLGLEITDVVPVKNILKTTSGKVQRYKFGELYKEGNFSEVLGELNNLLAEKMKQRVAQKASSEVEERLVEILKDVLKISSLGVDDNFFEIGGNSLNATILLNKIHKEFTVDIHLSQLFENQTISNMAVLIEKIENAEYTQVKKVEEKAYYNVSSAQRRIFVLNSMDVHDTSYNIPVVLEVSGDINIQRLKTAIEKIIDRHEALRTSFELIDGEPVQRVHKEIPFDIPFIDAGADKDIQDVLKKYIRPFDLYKAPLIRVVVIRQSNKHFILMDMHHIISDGSSVGILLNELLHFYQQEELPDVGIQYKDFSEWQNKLLKSDYIRKQEEYWVERFSNNIPILNLPTDFNRPSVQSFKGDYQTFSISEELTYGLNKLANQTGTTLYMVLLAAYNVLMFKYTGQNDIIIGSPIAGRKHDDISNVLGMFVNTLAMRNSPEGTKTFNQLLREVKENSIKAFENSDFQFEELVNKLQLTRDMSRNPLFDVMFTVQNMNVPNMVMDNNDVRIFEINNNIAKFDLTLYTFERKKGIDFNMEYSTSLFKKETIERLVNHFVAILEQITQSPHVIIDNIDMLSKEEKKQLLEEFNEKGKDYSLQKTIPQLFEEQVLKVPQNIAIVSGDRAMSYEELNNASNQLAWSLRERGVKPDSMVAMLMERSQEMIIGIMGILKSGGAYLPIDAGYPEARITSILADSGTTILLTQKSILNKYGAIFENFDLQIVLMDNFEHSFKDESNENPEVINSSSNLAYVMYTSGSTGKPKGNLTTHYNVIRVVKDTNYIEISSKDTLLQLSNYAFDGSTFDIFGALLNGAKLVFASSETVLDMSKLSNLIKNEKISIFFVTTALFNTLVDVNIECFENVRKVLFGGEKVSVRHVTKAFNYMGSGRLIHVYGPTESTVFATYYNIDTISDDMVTIPIGRPISNTRLYVLGKNLKLQPVGVAGELCIAGKGLVRGYFNRDDLTTEKFVINPVVPDEVIYRTGDLVRWLPDGNIEFLDRMDTQVKIRGFRIELGEIEAQLLSQSQIKEAVVIAKKNSSGNMYLCTYFVSDEEVDLQRLKFLLAKVLPDYMIPTSYVRLDKMPLNQNGKIDKNKLLAQEDIHVSSEKIEEAKTEVEKEILGIWRNLLGFESIGLHDNFFDLGGNSLLVIRMHTQIDKLYSGQTSVTDIFANPTIYKLASFIEHKNKKGNDIKLRSVRLPKDYFHEDLSQNIKIALDFKIKDSLFDKLSKAEKSMNTNKRDILFAAYACLIYKLNANSSFSVQLLEGEDVHAIDLDMGKWSRLSGLIDRIKNQKGLSSKFPLKDILDTEQEMDEFEVMALFYEKSDVRMNTNLFKVYGIVLEFEENPSDVSFTCKYNGRKFNKDKIVKLINQYIGLTNLLLNEYLTNESGVMA